MKPHHSRGGFTRVEAIVLIAAILLLISQLLPLTVSNRKSPAVRCLNNLKLLAMSYDQWAEDHGGRYPAAVSRAEGGWHDFLTNGNAGAYCWTNYSLMFPYLRTRDLLYCSTDIRRGVPNFFSTNYPKPGENVSSNRNSGLSYFVGVSASPKDPQSILGGDRNLSLGSKRDNDYGFSPADNNGNDVVIKTNLTYSWSRKMHSAQSSWGSKGLGAVVFADGHAEFVRSERLGALFQSAAITTNSTPQPTNSDIRLVFP